MTASGSKTSIDCAVLLERGLAFHQAGQLQEAFNVYQEILSVEPAHADALHLTGEVLYRAGQYQNALQYLNHAIAQTPHHFYMNTRSLVFLEMRLLQEAENDLLRAIKLVPNYLEAHINISNVYRNKANFKKAKLFAEKALQISPSSAAAWSALGAVQMETNQLEDALETFSKSLELAPNAFATIKNKSKILVAMKKWHEVLPVLENVKDVQDFDMGIMLSRTYQVLGHAEKAITPFQTALRSSSYETRKAYFTTDESIAQIFSVCEALSVYRSNYVDIAELYELAIEALPEHTGLLNNLAVSQFNQAIFDKAMINYRKLLEIEPSNTMARTNLGSNLSIQGRSEEAIIEFAKVLEFDPNYVPAAGLLLSEKNKIADWNNIEDLRQKVAHLLDRPNNTQSVNAFILLCNYDDPSKFLEWSRTNARENFANLGVKHAPASGKGRYRERIKVGYFSVDFRNHPVAHLTAPLFELHDKSKYEIFVYSYGDDDGHPVRQRIKNSAEHFVNLYGCSIQGMAERIRGDEVDILVDLSGNTRNAKIQVMGHRPAPVQVHWLGFIGSMGSKYYDYTIVDNFVAPANADQYYDEKLLRMPDSFQINDTTRPQLPATLSREQCLLPSQGFVFADFNQSFKIQPEMFQAWVTIVKSVPGSVLWLTEGHEGYINNIKKAWLAAGLEDDRLIFAARVGVNEYLAQYQFVDLFLDVYPYTSGTTASDALWAGCPLLALVGKTMVARMSGSLVKAAGLPELITYTYDEYIQKAIYLANNPTELQILKKRLVENRMSMPLFNTSGFVRHLEKAFEEMAHKSWAGDDLSAITIL